MTLHGEMPIYGGLVPLGFQVEKPPVPIPIRLDTLFFIIPRIFQIAIPFSPICPPGKAPQPAIEFFQIYDIMKQTFIHL